MAETKEIPIGSKFSLEKLLKRSPFWAYFGFGCFAHFHYPLNMNVLIEYELVVLRFFHVLRVEIRPKNPVGQNLCVFRRKLDVFKTRSLH